MLYTKNMIDDFVNGLMKNIFYKKDFLSICSKRNRIQENDIILDTIFDCSANDVRLIFKLSLYLHQFN